MPKREGEEAQASSPSFSPEVHALARALLGESSANQCFKKDGTANERGEKVLKKAELILSRLRKRGWEVARWVRVSREEF